MDRPMPFEVSRAQLIVDKVREHTPRGTSDDGKFASKRKSHDGDVLVGGQVRHCDEPGIKTTEEHKLNRKKNSLSRRTRTDDDLLVFISIYALRLFLSWSSCTLVYTTDTIQEPTAIVAPIETKHQLNNPPSAQVPWRPLLVFDRCASTRGHFSGVTVEGQSIGAWLSVLGLLLQSIVVGSSLYGAGDFTADLRADF